MGGFTDLDLHGKLKEVDGLTLMKRVNATLSLTANGNPNEMTEAKICSRVAHFLDVGNIDGLIGDPEALETLLLIIDGLAPPGHTVSLG